MATFGYTFNLPPKGASDVAKRELTFKFSDGREPVTAVANDDVDALVSKEFPFGDEGEPTITVVLQDVDQKGNVSGASPEFSFKVVDDVAPPAPGQLGVASKRQID